MKLEIDSGNQYKAYHSGLTDDEMYVPLMIL